MRFENQIVLITGAAGNLGRALGQLFAEQGATLVLLGRSAAHLEQVFGAPTQQRLHWACDLLDPLQTQNTVAAAIERCGRINVLCNCAGGFVMGQSSAESATADWAAMADLNCKTLLHMSRAVVPYMVASGGGKIVNVAAYSALKGGVAMAAYCAAKAGVIRITESMAAELRSLHINVNCVLPTILDTPQNRQAMPKTDPALWVQPRDLAQVMLFLSSPEANAMHGASVAVTGLS